VAKTIFRKIGGRIVPIRIGSVRLDTDLMGGKARDVFAKVGDTVLGHARIVVPDEGKFATLDYVRVNHEFRGKGIGRSLFKHAQELLGRAGKSFLRADKIQHQAQVKIRASAGKSVFIGYGRGQAKKLSPLEAINEVKKLRKGLDYRDVQATTMIPKKWRRK